MGFSEIVGRVTVVGAGPEKESVGASEVPHSPQNLNCAGLLNPQFGQSFVCGAPHSPQNFIASGFSVPQLEQINLRVAPRKEWSECSSDIRHGQAKGLAGKNLPAESQRDGCKTSLVACRMASTTINRYPRLNGLIGIVQWGKRCHAHSTGIRHPDWHD